MQYPKPRIPTVVTFTGGPNDGSVHTDDDLDANVLMARFIAFVYEDKGTADVVGNMNAGSRTPHRYTLTSVKDRDGVRYIAVAYASHQTG